MFCRVLYGNCQSVRAIKRQAPGQQSIEDDCCAILVAGRHSVPFALLWGHEKDSPWRNIWAGEVGGGARKAGDAKIGQQQLSVIVMEQDIGGFDIPVDDWFWAGVRKVER